MMLNHGIDLVSTAEEVPDIKGGIALASPNSGLRLHSGPFVMLCLIWARIHASCRDERRSAIHGKQTEIE